MRRKLGTLNTQQVKKVIVTEMDLWRRSARKSRKEKFLNETIRAAVNAGKDILEVIEENPLRYFEHVNNMTGNILPRRILGWEAEVMRRKGRPKETWMDRVRRGMTERGLTEEVDKDRDMWRNLVLDEE
jgi:hypothetical protein